MLLPLLHHVAITNITILSIFKVILFEFDYRTVNVFTSGRYNYFDVVHEMMNILTNHSKPTHILNFDRNLSDRKRCEEPILNVIFVVNNTMELVEAMKANIYPNDISLILDFSVQNSQIETNIQNQMQVSNKVLIITNLSVLALYPFRHHKMDILPLYPFHIKEAKAFIQSYVHSSNHLRQEKKLTIFSQYLSPRSMLAFLESGIFYVGADGSIASILLKKLNATGRFVSDVGRVYPSMARNFNNVKRESTEADIYKYYRNALTNNKIMEFNVR